MELENAVIANKRGNNQGEI